MTNFLFCLVRNLIQQQKKQQNKLCSLFHFFKTFLAPKSRRDINFRGKIMAGRSSSKTLMNLPLRKKALPVIPHFFTFFFFFLWTCEAPSWPSIPLFRHDFGEPMASGNPKKFHKSGQRFMAAGRPKAIIYHALRFRGSEFQGQLGTAPQSWGSQTRSWWLGPSEVLLTHMSGLWWWTSTGETQLIVSLVPPSGLV